MSGSSMTDMGGIALRVRASCREDGDCFIWQLATGRGFPRLTLHDEAGKTKTIQPRRVVWEDKNGPIPKGLYVAMTCRCRLCLNPAHMELLTRSEIVKRVARDQPDTQAKRRAAGLKQRGRNAVIDMEKARYIRASEKKGTELAQELGVSESTISMARRSLYWAEQGNPFAGLLG